MDLRQVEYVVAIVDHGGFTRAAAALHVAQPSLSQSVRKLERELGVPLFVRRARGVELSGAGQAFLGEARRLLRAAERAKDEVGAHAGLRAGTLDIVALPTLVADPLAALLGGFRSRHPDVMVRIAEPSGSRSLTDMVADGRCEIGITESGPLPDHLRAVALGAQRLLAVFAPGRGPSAGRSVRLAVVAREPLVMGPPGTSIRDLVDRAFAAARLEAAVAVETVQREAIVPLVLAGAGSSVLPEALAEIAVQRGAVALPIDPPLQRVLALVHPVDDLSPAARVFIDEAARPRSLRG